MRKIRRVGKTPERGGARRISAARLRFAELRRALVFQLLGSVLLIFTALTALSAFVTDRRQKALMDGLLEEVESASFSFGQESLILVLDEAQIRSTMEFRLFSLLIFLLTLLAGGLIYYVVIRRVMGPLKLLAERVSEIDLKAPPNLKGEELRVKSSRELEELSGSLEGALRQLYEGYEKEKRFAANAAHEFRTPLAVMRTGIDVFRRRRASEREENEETEALLRLLDRNIARLTNLTEGILLLNRGEPLRVTEFSLGGLLEELCLDLEEKAERAGVRIFHTGEDILLRSDDTLLGRALLNLAENALKYSLPGGSAELRAGRCKETGMVRIEALDRGVGIPEEAREKVFDLFYRVDSSRSRESGGCGIGLALTKAIAERLGGSVSLREREGGGSIFCLELPDGFRTAGSGTALKE